MNGSAGPTANGKWGQFIDQLKTAGIPMDINALVQWVLRESYLETIHELRLRADKVRYFNEQKKAIRNHVRKVREQHAKLVGHRSGSVQAIKLLPYTEHGRAFAACKTRVVKSSEWEAYVENWEKQLSSISDDAQLANIDLQNVLQKQQQALQMMSNVSKMLHDTAMAVIRKIG